MCSIIDYIVIYKFIINLHCKIRQCKKQILEYSFGRILILVLLNVQTKISYSSKKLDYMQVTNMVFLHTPSAMILIHILIIMQRCHSLSIKQPSLKIYTNNHENCQKGEYEGIIRIAKVSSIILSRYDYNAIK